MATRRSGFISGAGRNIGRATALELAGRGCNVIIMGNPAGAHISAAKHGVWGLTKALAREFGPNGVTVNAISPGPIDADGEDLHSERRDGAVARLPLGRMGSNAEIAAVCGLLCSDEGGYVSGQMIAVNGGGAT
jgi:3-oxoacyl-[acyl-carrier protein] reductase